MGTNTFIGKRLSRILKKNMAEKKEIHGKVTSTSG